jgi:hypothetical protein
MQALLEKSLFDQLPRTFSTFFYDRIKDWKLQFPAEQRYFENLFALLEGLRAAVRDELFQPLREVEQRMGVNDRNWPAREFSLANVDFLNRSPYYPAWRTEIAKIFSRLDPVLEEEIARRGRPRLVLVASPADLPFGPDRMWLRIRSQGKLVPLESEMDLESFLPYLVEEFAGRQGVSPYDSWLIEASHRFTKKQSRSVGVSFDALQGYRTLLMAEVRRVVELEQIRGPRQLGQRLREIRVKAPTTNPLLAEFVRSVLLNGNGTLLLNNTFVQWAATQAFRRARPVAAAIVFGVRNKVKPFSSLLIYADQEQATPIPSQMDTLGSYVDLEIFYQYLYRECEKYAEYRNHTVYVFVGEGMDEMLVIAPERFRLPAGKTSVSSFRHILWDWLAG